MTWEEFAGVCLFGLQGDLFQVETECFIPAPQSQMHIIFVTPVNKHL